MNEEDNDFGFSFAEDIEKVVKQNAKETAAANSKAKKIYDMIMPFLNNLKKNPDMPTIVWPNRVEKIDEFIAKLDKVIAGK